MRTPADRALIDLASRHQKQIEALVESTANLEKTMAGVHQHAAAQLSHRPAVHPA